MIDTNECSRCGVGYILPSGRCDHCNTLPECRADTPRPRKLVGSGRVAKAIEIITDSRRSHETWIAWYRQQPGEEAKHADTCGDVSWHQQCIEGYDLVLDVLRQTMATTIAQEQASDGEGKYG